MIKINMMLRNVAKLIILLYNVISKTLQYIEVVQTPHYQIDVVVN